MRLDVCGIKTYVWSRWLTRCFLLNLFHVRPSPKITWKKDGEIIRLEESSFKISQSFYGRRLSIQNVDKELHEGTYTCEAQNDLNEENPISFNFTLNVEGTRNFLQSPQNIRIPNRSQKSRRPINRRHCASDNMQAHIKLV